MTEKTYYSLKGNDLLLDIQVQTKAGKNAIIGLYNQRLKLAITAAPSEGKANECLIKFLAKQFAVPQNQVKIIRGYNTKYKSLLISNPKNKLAHLFLR